MSVQTLPINNGLTGIIFNGKSTHELNVGWKTTSRPTSPQKKIFVFSPSAYDGSYDFSTYNPDNRPHYESSELSGEIMVVNEQNLQQTQIKVQQVMQWLHSANGRPVDFIFEDTPNRIYTATFQDATPITNYEANKNVTITVTFKIEPFPRSGIFKANYNLQGNNILPFTIGSFYTKPTLTLQGNFSNLQIKSNTTNRMLEYKGFSTVADTTVLDFKTESVTQNGQFFNEYLVGDFWEFTPFNKDNILEISLVGSAFITVEYPIMEVY